MVLQYDTLISTVPQYTKAMEENQVQFVLLTQEVISIYTCILEYPSNSGLWNYVCKKAQPIKDVNDSYQVLRLGTAQDHLPNKQRLKFRHQESRKS